MVGRGQEQPSIVGALLDVQRVRAKPQYTLAAEVRLHIQGCGTAVSAAA